MTEPSATYLAAIEAARIHHGSSKTYSGKLMRPYKWRIKTLIERTGCETALDYGCGKGLQWFGWETDGGKLPSVIPTLQDWFGLKSIHLFDPAYPPFAARPTQKFDLVIVTNVLAGVPEQDLDYVLDDIASFATKAVFIGQRAGSPKKKVNANLLNDRPREFWEERISRIKSASVDFYYITNK